MSLLDLLYPGGQPIGNAGGRRKDRQNIREVPGGQQAADDLFAKLGRGGTAHTPPGYPGSGAYLPDGGWVGVRPAPKSGPPTIDVDIPGIPIKKIKFV